MIAKLKKNSKKIYRFLDHKSIGNPLIFFLMLLILPITVLGVQQTVKYLSRAAGTAEVAFAPTTINLPPDAAIKININGNGAAVAFARVVFTFDKSKVKLTSEITPSASLSTVVEKTTMASANTTGQAVIVLAASPSDTQPSANFELASFNIGALSANPASALQFVPADIQIVEGSGTKMTINPVNAQINGGGGGGTNPTNTPPVTSAPTNPPVSGAVSFAFNPSSANLPPDGTFKIMLNAASKKIVFVRTVVTFDQSKVNLASEITPNPVLATVVEKTTMAAANASGRAVIVLAAAPSSTLPTGNFEFAALSFTAQTTSPGNVTVNFDSNDMQVVDDTTIPLSFSVTPLVLSINGASPPPGGGGGGNPQACQNRGSIECYNQWKEEYLGTLTSKVADLNSDGIVDLGDFEFWRRSAYP